MEKSKFLVIATTSRSYRQQVLLIQANTSSERQQKMISSLTSLVRREGRKISQWNIRTFSSGSAPSPLYLWLGEGENSAENSPRLLLPVAPPSAPTVFTSDDVLRQVNAHYKAETNFVGGMGEDDPGVWFASVNSDPLAYAELVQESISSVKEERHGVPFSLFTSGLVLPSIPLVELGLSSVHVSLYAGSPKDYAMASKNSEKDFGMLCGFIVEAAEQGIAVEAWVLNKYAAAGRDLAVSLGAQDVKVVAD